MISVFLIVFGFFLFIGIARFVLLAFSGNSFEGIRPLLNHLTPLRNFYMQKFYRKKCEDVLAGFVFYQDLSPELKEKFMQRLWQFMVEKKFTGNKTDLTDEQRISISACAMQLMFGLEEFTMPFYDTIVLYQNYIRDPRTGAALDYMLRNNGEIYLSWRAFEDGYKNSADSTNAGLAAFAEAIQTGVELFPGDDEMLSGHFAQWESETENIYSRFKKGSASSPAKEEIKLNRKKFFASIIEYFFEAPQKLKGLYPDLYGYLVQLLNQDPLEPGKQIATTEIRKYESRWRRERKLAYANIFTFVIGDAIILPFAFYMTSRTAIPLWAVIVSPIVLFFLLLLPQLLKPADKRILPKTRLLGFFGIAGLIPGVLLQLNYSTASGTPIVETYRITSADAAVHHYSRRAGGSGYTTFSYWYSLANNAYSDSPLLRDYYGRSPHPGSGLLQFTFKRGWLGLKALVRTDWLDNNGAQLDAENEDRINW